MNIVEAYTKYNGQLVIFISGLIGCGKSKLAKKISESLKLKLVDQYDYFKKDYNSKTTLPDKTEHVNWYTDDAFDWDKLNNDIQKSKKDGIVIVGSSLVDDKIKATPDYHLHLSISKKMCMEKRKIFVEKNKEKYVDDFKYLNTPTEGLKMNQLIFPYYLNAKGRSQITKYLNANEMDFAQMHDGTWNLLIEFINSNVEDVYEKWNKKHGNDVGDNNDVSAGKTNYTNDKITSKSSKTILDTDSNENKDHMDRNMERSSDQDFKEQLLESNDPLEKKYSKDGKVEFPIVGSI
jgi:tRNA A37 threonylcarbamoyladenosine biosynthesis protein TsaE